MKRLMSLAALALAIACAAAGSGGPLETTVVTRGSYAMGELSEPQAMAARDEATLRRLWTTFISEGEPPRLGPDETVVFLFAGSRRTGGYSIGEPKARIAEDGILVVEAVVEAPEAGGIVTQALTSPYLVLKVNTRTFADLFWKR